MPRARRCGAATKSSTAAPRAMSSVSATCPRDMGEESSSPMERSAERLSARTPLDSVSTRMGNPRRKRTERSPCGPMVRHRRLSTEMEPEGRRTASA